jgi:PilZ domain
MTDTPDDRRARPRAGLPGVAVILRAGSADPVAFAIRDLSANGARLVGRVQLVDGERIRVLLKLEGVELLVEAEVVRTEPQNAQVAIAFRDLSSAAREMIEQTIDAMVERVRVASLLTVLIVGAPAETRGAIERDLAQLGRRSRPCATMLEAMWSLHDPSIRYEAVIVASDALGESLGALLEHLAEHHPTIRRLLLFGDQLKSVDHASSSRVDAVLRTPLRIRALARALGVGATDSSVGLLLSTEPEP